MADLFSLFIEPTCLMYYFPPVGVMATRKCDAGLVSYLTVSRGLISYQCDLPASKACGFSIGHEGAVQTSGIEQI